MRLKNIRKLLPGIILFSVTTASANSPSFEELLAMDIIELSNVKVTVASKREEEISQAPSIISIVTAQEIRRYGANNLKDILNRVTSIQGIGSHFYSHLISMRGQMIGHNNSDIQFLINGRPYRTSWNGGTPYRLLLSFPIDVIERIEIIRGPGSVLYGTGAFTGVIDIITRKTHLEQHSELGLTYGSQESRGVNASTVYHSGDFGMTAGLQLFKTDGWEFEITDEVGVHDTLYTGEDNKGVMLTTHYDGWKINVLSTSVNLDNIGGPPRWPASTQEAEHLLVDVGYKYEITPDWSWENHLTYNQFDFMFLNNALAEQLRDSEDLLIESTIKSKLSNEFEFLLGGTYEQIEGTVSPGFDYKSYRYSAYQQMDISPTENHRFTLGVQVNKVQETDSDLSPRFAYVAQFDKVWGMKLLHSKAFRSAVATERFLPPGNAVLGDPSLDPEKIKTTELQLFMNTEKSFAAVTLFRSKITDVIDRFGSPLMFQNTPGNFISKGVELESRSKLFSQTNAIASITYQENENTDNNITTFSPNWMAKIGLDFTLSQGVIVSIFDSYFGDAKPVSKVNPAVLNVNPPAEAYHLVTAKAILDLNRIGAKNMMFSVYIDNLLDEDIYYPEINRGPTLMPPGGNPINTIPIYSGRAYYGKFELRF